MRRSSLRRISSSESEGRRLPCRLLQSRPTCLRPQRLNNLPRQSAPHRTAVRVHDETIPRRRYLSGRPQHSSYCVIAEWVGELEGMVPGKRMKKVAPWPGSLFVQRFPE